MAGAQAFYYIAVAAAATGAVVESRNAAAMELERARQLEAELRTSELAAIDEANQRLIDLRFANDEILSNAGGVGAYSSSSLVAARKFNFRMADQDQQAAQLNMATDRASTSSKIGILRSNARTFRTVGILNAISTVAGGVSKGAAFKKPPPIVSTSDPSILGGEGSPV